METLQKQNCAPISKRDLESVFTKAGFWRPGVLSRNQLSAAWSHLKYQHLSFTTSESYRKVHLEQVIHLGFSRNHKDDIFYSDPKGPIFIIPRLCRNRQ